MSFSDDVNRFAKKAGRSMDKAVRGICIKLGSGIIRDTPVDTGRLRGNWVFNFGRPDKSTSSNVDKEGAMQITLLTSTVTGFPKGKEFNFYMTNSLPYVFPIEYEGHSHTKSPAGMVRKNISRIKRNLR